MDTNQQRVRWTEKSISNIRGKHFVVTGGNSGLGLETVKQLALNGATVTMACRSVTKGKSAVAELVASHGPLEIDVRELDLADLTSVRDFAAALSTSPIDVLVNNAGVMALPRAETKDGFEMQFGTNHLGHFALTGHLWSGLMKSTNPRVVTVASNAHKPGRIDFDDLMGTRRYSRGRAYAQSKLANILFARELQRRAEQAGFQNFKSLAAHPGYSATNLSSHTVAFAPSIAQRIWHSVEQVIAQPATMGALPQLYAATETDLPGGAYIGPDGWGEWRGYPRLVTPSTAARDWATAERLWKLSEELTSVRWL